MSTARAEEFVTIYCFDFGTATSRFIGDFALAGFLLSG